MASAVLILSSRTLNCAFRARAGREAGRPAGDADGHGLGGALLVISHAKPLARLSPQRPHPDIFSLYVFASILGQFAVHLAFLATTYRGALAAMPPVRPLGRPYHAGLCRVRVSLEALWGWGTI